ncbi:hypothetical protein CAOG_06126 [Capsaspora owczarzaki ATCC 30864]|uniref:Uncharacterized protein n=1 Tax=Capsaspora owczarzaki (strain ATCC 30864) TaxID=595528 RepID=A0A0D2UKV2_CAPO3|nr:hypothetical protein CAOG_06126 [Capsaspora owczarzaki ATCC 30864]KJE95701.1 hypothetical protein CAOG_006126 [Capsaspora owczarzaki ATCC 30864]|eukprot:XP_004345716.1 hypothetical protein CAOG_06126 [Capsaspora owczarzaki ATCC 30864]
MSVNLKQIYRDLEDLIERVRGGEFSETTTLRSEISYITEGIVDVYKAVQQNKKAIERHEELLRQEQAQLENLRRKREAAHRKVQQTEQHRPRHATAQRSPAVTREQLRALPVVSGVVIEEVTDLYDSPSAAPAPEPMPIIPLPAPTYASQLNQDEINGIDTFVAHPSGYNFLDLAIRTNAPDYTLLPAEMHTTAQLICGSQNYIGYAIESAANRQLYYEQPLQLTM